MNFEILIPEPETSIEDFEDPEMIQEVPELTEENQPYEEAAQNPGGEETRPSTDANTVQNNETLPAAGTPSVLQLLVSYASSLVLRTYSLVIVIATILFVSLLLPEEMYTYWRLEIHADLVLLDLYFVPVFWILIDKEAFRFAEKQAKKIYYGIVNIFL